MTRIFFALLAALLFLPPVAYATSTNFIPMQNCGIRGDMNWTNLTTIVGWFSAGVYFLRFCLKLAGRTGVPTKTSAFAALLTAASLALLPFVFNEPPTVRTMTTDLWFPLLSFILVIAGGVLLQYTLRARHQGLEKTPRHIAAAVIGLLLLSTPALYAATGLQWLNSLGSC